MIIYLGNLIIKAVDEIKPKIKYIIPKQETVLKATNKKQLMDLALNLDINVPQNTTSKYPLIVKLNVSENVNLKAHQRYKIATNKEEYNKALAFFDEYKDNLIIQEYEGDAFGFLCSWIIILSLLIILCMKGL